MKIVRKDPKKAYLSNWLWVPKGYINLEGTKSALQVEYRDPHAEKTRYVMLWKETDHHLLIPRMLWRPEEIPFEVVDCRPLEYEHAPIKSRIRLDHKKERQPDGSKELVPTGRTVQSQALQALLSSQGGILQLACGLGKSVVFLELAARLQVPTLIIVETTQLLHQWQGEIEDCLEVPGGVGLIQADKFDWQKYVVLATYATIANKADTLPEEIRRWFGLVGWDEGHHVSAPTYSKSPDLFYGRRYVLTATPKRDDGLHVIYEYHVGPIVYKDLSQDLKPLIVFRHTNLRIDHTVPMHEVTDINGELHLSKLSAFNGKWLDRVYLVLQDIKDAVSRGRKVMLLTTSIDEAVNLLAVWTRGYPCQLYTDIPDPTPMEVGETLNPLFLAPKERKHLQYRLEALQTKVRKEEKRLLHQDLHPNARTASQTKKDKLEADVQNIEDMLKKDAVGKKVLSLKRKWQKAYRTTLLEESTTAGLMIHKVKPEERDHYLKTRPVIFAIARYGKEALDCQELDTIMVSTPFSSRNSLQQVMGRTSREDNIKHDPLVIVYEDDIPIIHNMCTKLRKHIMGWPLEDNGPYEYKYYGHPTAGGTRCRANLFGP